MFQKVKHKWFLDKKKKLLLHLELWQSGNVLMILLCHFYLLNKKFKDFKLIIIGDGPDKKYLKNLIIKKNLSNKVLILKPVLNLHKYFYNSDIFVLSSRVEGMPNVMIEAMMCGCTVVSTNCHTGPREILGKNKYGYLCKVNNPKDLSKNILKAINKKTLKNVLNILKDFEENNVIERHFSLLKIKKFKRLI